MHGVNHADWLNCTTLCSWFTFNPKYIACLSVRPIMALIVFFREMYEIYFGILLLGGDFSPVKNGRSLCSSYKWSG